MLRNNFLISALFFSVVIFGQNNIISYRSSDIISDFIRLSQQQLFDTANYYNSKNSTDTALVCYSLIINTPVKDNEFEQQKRIVEALNKSAIIYYYMSDYRSSYEFLIKALLLSEKYDYDTYISKIYNNIGNIYAHFNKVDIAKSFFLRALNVSADSTAGLLNNLGHIELENENIDSAYYYLNKSLQISIQQNYEHYGIILNSLASFYQKTKMYDSAFYYYRLSLEESRIKNNLENETEVLSNMGKLFLEIGKPDSAILYINKSNIIAEEINLLRIVAENFLTISKIEESKGNIRKAFEYYKNYVTQKDSVLNTEIFGDISQLQRFYEVSKTNKQIEELIIEKQIKENSIYYQNIIWFITLAVLLFVSLVLLYIFLQKRELNRSYEVLFAKNVEIIELLDSYTKTPEKYKNRNLTDAMQKNIQTKVLAMMENIPAICSVDFSLNKLSELIGINHAYVSQVIHTVLNTSFRSLLNSYRITEAQRLFEEPDAHNYTIEFVSNQVGFKSRAAFINAFKEITGVTPNYYCQSLKEKLKAKKALETP